MRYLIVLFLIMAFVAGCGCSNVLVPPALAANAKDIWPALYGVATNGADEGHFIVYDQLAGAWQAPRLIANDLLALQWTPQRNSVGWRGGAVGLTGGKYNVSFIEDTSNDLEIWESPDDGWQDDAGAWGLLDDDASENWAAVDVETRQNWVFAFLENADPLIYGVYIDLSAGAPAWVIDTASPKVPVDHSFSLVLDNTLRGISWGAYDNGLAGVSMFTLYITSNTATVPTASGDFVSTSATAYPQILWSGPVAYLFGTDTNILYLDISNEVGIDTDAGIERWEEPIYTATALDDDYHATWLAYDDTIHIALVDTDLGGNSLLVYLRRTPNGWVEEEILLTVDTVIDLDTLAWPQITVDSFGNIFIYYILGDVLTGFFGDLQGFYLDVDDYDNPVAASWTQHLNIDQSADLVKWVVAPDSVPYEAAM